MYTLQKHKDNVYPNKIPIIVSILDLPVEFCVI